MKNLPNIYSEGNIKLTGRSTLRAYPAGTVKDYVDKKIQSLPEPNYVDARNNLVVTVGKELVCDLLLDIETAGLTYHAIGTFSGAPTLSNATLGTEVERKLWTSKTRTLNVITYTAFYLAAECTYNIAEVGVFGGAMASALSDSGVLFSRLLQSYDNSAGLVDLTFEYELTIG